MMNSKSWTGTAVWREESEPFPIRKAAGPALLHLNDEGGSVAGRSYLPRDLEGRLPVWVGGGGEDREDALRWHPLPK